MFFENNIQLETIANLILFSPSFGLISIVMIIALAAILIVKLSDLRAIKHRFQDYKKDEPKIISALKTEIESLKTKNSVLNKKLAQLKKDGEIKSLEVTKLEQIILDLELEIIKLTAKKKDASEEIVVEYYTDRKSQKK